ncbi:neuronal acetylcholine receptor subunit alpha-2-like isoform X2 [Phymastichus coffea]|uniref:neuronal acetylcholine receptor subunit alpha-2-like isoform X2 n=1 Tax=Phymastichus coffea TaxID=108790 RepID=UPI00273C77C4|nr:neuronal acetylcholine receptor subunit alpha-2-like isoform X2 [Phymastichus coffea]
MAISQRDSVGSTLFTRRRIHTHHSGINITPRITLGFCRASLDCNTAGLKSPTLRLKRHLFCEYDVSVRPVTENNKAVNVSVMIAPKFMGFVERSSTFIIHTWVFINWKDEHLTWKPEDFDGVNQIKVKSDEIWVPDFSVYNSGDLERSQTGVPNTMCLLFSTGTISCVPTMRYTTQCDTDYTYWPYDKQKCSIRMGSWTHTGEEISLNFRKKGISMKGFTGHKQWLVTNYTSKKYSPTFNCCPNDTFPTLIANFYLQRHSPMMHAVYITPAVVLMVITLTVLWLDSRSIERISLASINFVCHILCLYDLHWMLPSNGISPPNILLFYRDSMVLATFAMIVTALLRKLQVANSSAPGWIVSTVTFMASNRAGRFLLLDNADVKAELSNAERDSEDTVESANVAVTKKHDDSWRKLAIIVEWIAFFATTFTYFLLLILLVPKYANS